MIKSILLVIKIKQFLFVLLLLSTAATCKFEHPEVDSNTEVKNMLRKVINSYFEKDQFAGSVLVAHEDNIFLEDGWGYANRDNNQHNTKFTRFRLGSMTKAFTGVLIMKLVETKRLNLDSPIGDYISDLPENISTGITIRHLLTHSSGLQEFYRVPEFKIEWLTAPPSPEELVRIVSKHPLEFEPGSQYTYRNIGFIALGLVIERVTELVYEEALEKYILDPAGMDFSGLEQNGDIIDQKANGYGRTQTGWEKGDEINPDLLYAAGGAYSTVTDLYRFSEALEDNLLLNSETQKHMFSPQIKESKENDNQRYYAFGWHVDKLTDITSDSTITIIEHGGDVTNFETLLTLIPSLNATIILLHNHGETDQNEIRDEIIRVLMTHSVRQNLSKK